jgi:glycine cleavage system regulatory protein
MKPTEMLSQIKTLLKARMSLAQQTLENGTIIEAESFEAGQQVFVVSDEERVALPVGEYALEDGMTLVVEEEGLIAEIKEAAAEEEEVQEEQLEEEVVVEDVPEEVVEEVAAVVEAVVEAIAPVLEEVKQEVEELKKKFESYDKKKEEKMSSQKPATKPLKHNPEKNNTRTVHTYADNRSATMLDRVFNKLSK